WCTFFFFSSRRRHTRSKRDWSSDVCSSDLVLDLGWAADFTGALVLAWQGGMESGRALADVLTGRVNPSGRLSDTIARDYGDYPRSEERRVGKERRNEWWMSQ